MYVNIAAYGAGDQLKRVEVLSRGDLALDILFRRRNAVWSD
jgi:hypothetical protein